MKIAWYIFSPKRKMQSDDPLCASNFMRNSGLQGDFLLVIYFSPGIAHVGRGGIMMILVVVHAMKNKTEMML